VRNVQIDEKATFPAEIWDTNIWRRRSHWEMALFQLSLYVTLSCFLQNHHRDV